MKLRAHINSIIILCLVIGMVAFKWSYLSLPFFWDEAWPYSTAVHAMYNHGISLIPGSISPSISRGHPLLFYCMAAAWMKLFGTSVFAIHLFALLISVLL